MKKEDFYFLKSREIEFVLSVFLAAKTLKRYTTAIIFKGNVSGGFYGINVR